MTIAVILILGVLWVAVLVPPILRARGQQGRSDSVGDFTYKLSTLGRANGRLDSVDLRLVRPGTFEQLTALQREQAAGINANQVKVPRLLRNPEQRALLQRGVLVGSPLATDLGGDPWPGPGDRMGR